LGFILAINRNDTWLLYLLSALLMLASPFFTSGRSAILPSIANKEELHTANSLTQTTQWTTLTIGSFLGGASVTQFGYKWAFAFNALSFLFSAACISKLRATGGSFRAQRAALTENEVVRPWHEYTEGLRYMRASPLILGIALLAVGWASGGGASQILFSLFGELVFNRGPSGIGYLWGSAGIGLLVGGSFAHWLGKRISFEGYKKTVSICYLIHGGSYIVFSQMPSFALAILFLGISRAAIAVSSVLNTGQLLRHVSDAFRGRVFATIETLTWSMMMLSMLGAGVASRSWSPRTIGLVAGVFSSSTAFFMCPGHERWHPAPGFYYLRGGGPMLDIAPYYLTAIASLLGPYRSALGLATTPTPERYGGRRSLVASISPRPQRSIACGP